MRAVVIGAGFGGIAATEPEAAAAPEPTLAPAPLLLSAISCPGEELAAEAGAEAADDAFEGADAPARGSAGPTM